MAFLATLRPMRLAHPAQRNKNREKVSIISVLSCSHCNIRFSLLCVFTVDSEVFEPTGSPLATRQDTIHIGFVCLDVGVVSSVSVSWCPWPLSTWLSCF